MDLLLFTLSFLVALSVVNCQNGIGPRVTCPLPNQHCDCTVSGDVLCFNVNSIPDQLPNTTVFLELENNFIGPVVIKDQVDRLQDLPLERLYISNNNLEIIQDFAFETLYRLLELDISENRIQVLTENTFRGLKSLTDLYANDAGITTLSPRVFEQITTLKYIDLEDNSLTTIGLEFTILPNLETLLLAENQITVISRGAFSGLNRLKHLSLFGNNLRTSMSSWFRGIVQNNGHIELDRRSNSLVADPNPWLCCSDISQYYNYVKGSLSRNLISYSQLNLACFWPVEINGRLISSLTTEELSAIPCSDFTTSTRSVDSTSTTTKTSETISKSILAEGNFLSSLSDLGAGLILLLVAVLTGCVVGSLCCCYRTKKGKQRFHAFANIFQPNRGSGDSEQLAENKNSSELSQRPYRQESPNYGVSVSIDGTNGMQKPPEQGYSNYTLETDHSEEEVWSKDEPKLFP